jgi:hypothetical protein
MAWSALRLLADCDPRSHSLAGGMALAMIYPARAVAAAFLNA